MIYELFIIQTDKNAYGSLSYRNSQTNKCHRLALDKSSEINFRNNGSEFLFNDHHIVCQ